MVRPLTKIDSKGALYTRPLKVETQIESASQLLEPDLRTYLCVTDRKDPRYLSSECLVHLVRKGRRSGDQQLMSAVLPVLLGRCEANLQVKVSDGSLPNAADLRQEILEDLTDLFVTDGTGESPDELDVYECRFNMVFKTLRIDAIRRSKRQSERSIEIVDVPESEAIKGPDAYEFVDERPSTTFEKHLSPEESDMLQEQVIKAIEELPCEERDAFVLVNLFGYKIESTDQSEETAATRCNCSGRTIRTRLAQATEKLSHFKEGQ